MLLGIAGVSGIGKSYYKDYIAHQLGFETVKIITDRPPRPGEQNGVDKIFMTTAELQRARERGDIAYAAEMCGHLYAYSKSELASSLSRNLIMEVHYSTIFDLKKVAPHLRTVYLTNPDLDLPKSKVRARGLAPDAEATRLAEIDEHHEHITTHPELLAAFDFRLENHYDPASDHAFLRLVQSLLGKSPLGQSPLTGAAHA